MKSQNSKRAECKSSISQDTTQGRCPEKAVVGRRLGEKRSYQKTGAATILCPYPLEIWLRPLEPSTGQVGMEPELKLFKAQLKYG